jgi:hypothetical protein
MVRDLGARRGRRFFGELTDNSLIAAAALALMNGHGDPMRLLAMDPDDFRLTLEAVQKAERLRREQRKQELEFLAESIGAKVGSVLARAFG